MKERTGIKEICSFICVLDLAQAAPTLQEALFQATAEHLCAWPGTQAAPALQEACRDASQTCQV